MVDDETPSQSALTTDRGLPIGNSRDVFGRRALHVKVGNDDSEPLPVALVSGSGDPYFAEADAATTPGVQQTLISSAVPAAKTRNLSQAIVICRQEGEFAVMAGSTKIGSGRTGASHPMARFTWIPARPIAAGTTVEVLFTARNGSPAVDVECYLQGSEGPP